MTWNMKKRVIKLNSRPVFFGMPWNLPRSRKMIGRSIVRTTSRTGGRIPFVFTKVKISAPPTKKSTHRNNADHWARKMADPTKEFHRLADEVHVRYDTDEGH
jgi:hypothetical protein